MKMSNQMMASVMFALQNSLATQSDIVPMFEEWDLYVENDQVLVKNPPVVQATPIEEQDDDELTELLKLKDG